MVKLIISHTFRNQLSTLKEYMMDLGSKYTEVSDANILKANIQDKFVLEFLSSENTLVYKVGRLGSIELYTYMHLPENQVWVYKDDKKYIREYSELDATINIKRYLAEILMSIEHNKDLEQK